jgi:NADH:ubiquinone oxidoreductase subunit 2 (subunit N)
MLIASILITTQYSIQRFFALSSISHMGFLVLQFSYSYLIYVYIYTISSLFLFSLFKDNNSHIFLKIFITFLLFSLSGLPPLPGFYTKLYIIMDLLNLGLYSVIIVLLFSSMIITGNYIYLGLISLKLNSYNNYYSHSNLLAIFMTLFLFLNVLF